MITKLTKEQEARFPEFVQKWTQIGLSTNKLNREAVTKALGTAFQQVNKPPPRLVVCTSPMAACLTRAVLASVSDSVLASVSASVRDSVSDSVSAWYYWQFGQYAAYWLAFCDFFSILGVNTSPLSGNECLCKEAGFSMLFWKLALVSEKPIHIFRNEQGQLHRDGGPALVHSDGFGVWALNGIRMKPDYIETPAERLAPETVLAEPNADIRRELIRKVGIERMLAKLPHKVLHRRDNYEVLSIRLSDEVRDARYLKMLNPSISVFHMEGIPAECDTVEKSLNWRNQNWHRLMFFMHDRCCFGQPEQHPFANLDQFRFVIFDDVRVARFAMRQNKTLAGYFLFTSRERIKLAH